MFMKSETRSPVLATALSVAFFALMTGMSQAQDTDPTDPTELTGEETILIAGPVIDGGEVPCDPCDEPADDGVLYAIDPIEVFDGEPINTDGIGDGEPLPDVVIDDEMGEVIGEEPVVEVTAEEFPDSNCGGCELQNMAGGPEVQRTVTGATVLSSGGNGHGNIGADAEAVSNENNICYNAELYIPLLCDWQRPFVGDLMP